MCDGALFTQDDVLCAKHSLIIGSADFALRKEVPLSRARHAEMGPFTPYGCCARCCTGCVVLTLLGAAALVAYPVSRKGLVYYKDLFGHIGGGVKFHLERDVGGLGVVPHADKQVYLRYATVAERLKALPEELEADAGVRHLAALAENDINSAGYEGISSWPHIALGAGTREHRVMREFLNARVSHRSPASLWSAKQLRKSAEAFIAGRDRMESVESAACAWVDIELWRIILGIEMPLENATELCGTYMMDFLVRYAIAPDWARHLPGDPLGFEGVRAMQRGYLDHFRSSEVVRAYAEGDADKVDQVAHVVHDTIALAGGLSVPGIIANVVWVVHNGSGVSERGLVPPAELLPLLHGADAVARLTEPSTLRRLVLEVARLLPKVTFVPMDYPERGGPTLLSLEAALVDGAVWGDAPHAIRLDRDVDVDVRTGPYGTAWAHQANADGGHTARGCPGMGLSLAMVEGFVGAFLAEFDEWQVSGPPGEPLAAGGGLVRKTVVAALKAEAEARAEAEAEAEAETMRRISEAKKAAKAKAEGRQEVPADREEL